MYHPIIDRLKTIAELLPTAIGGEFVPSGTKQISITENGTTTENVFSYANAEISVNVPTGITPTGTKQISITQNGTTTEDVTNYASAEITVNVPTGPSLPSIISKIDGGSFTPSSDTDSATYNISHNLGEVPSGVAIWATNMDRVVYSVRCVDYYIAVLGNFVLEQVNTNATRRAVDGPVTSGDFTANSIKMSISGNYYKADTTYNWLVWA